MVHRDLTTLEAVALAVRSEIESTNLYEKLVDRVKNPEVKKMLKDLAADEEMHRESLVPLVLGALSCGETVGALAWLDDPKPHASVAFAPGDVEAELVEAIKELCFDGAKEENAWNAAVSGITTRCSRVVCKVSGAPGVTVWGRAEGELPPPDI